MPFVSKKQQAWGNSPAGIKALGGKKAVAHWNKETPKNIPKVAPKKKSK